MDKGIIIITIVTILLIIIVFLLGISVINELFKKVEEKGLKTIVDDIWNGKINDQIEKENNKNNKNIDKK